jgi:hypothetical protein
VYSSQLAQQQRQSAEAYLAWKWGIQNLLPSYQVYLKYPPPPLATYIAPSIPITAANLLLNLDAGNVASYPGSGSTWTDLAGSGLVTTLYGSPTYSSANGGYLAFVPSSSQYAQTSASLSVLTQFSVEVWHYYNGTFAGGQPCILTEVFVGGINFFLGSLLVSPPQLQFGFFNGSFNITPSGYSLPAVGWYQLVGTFNGSVINLYVNNVLTQTQGNNQTPTSGASGIRLMRRWDNPDYWGGYLSIIRIYSRALTATEITANYNASKARFGLS